MAAGEGIEPSLSEPRLRVSNALHCLSANPPNQVELDDDECRARYTFAISRTEKPRTRAGLQKNFDNLRALYRKLGTIANHVTTRAPQRLQNQSRMYSSDGPGIGVMPPCPRSPHHARFHSGCSFGSAVESRRTVL